MPPVITAVAVAGSKLATAGDDHAIRVWDWKQGKLCWTHSGHDGWVRSMALSLDSRWLATAGNDGRVRLWGFSDGELIAGSQQHPAAVTALCWIPNDDRLLAAHFDGSIVVYGVPDLVPVDRWSHAGADVRAVAVLSDPPSLAVGDRSGTLSVYELHSGRLQATVRAHRGRLRALAVKDGQIFSGGEDGCVSCWSCAQGEWIERWRLELPARVNALLCLESLLVAGCSDNTLRLIDTASATVQQELSGHCGSVTALASAGPCGLLSASFDTSVRYWQRQGTQEESP
ncbi:MAG: hypothetical protein KatS3mg110_2551 [Pirellulaceae bacterium]|nr:MAG: hypothetical protein KatS3mg110_2551 [Pirellulaceae bacterium]